MYPLGFHKVPGTPVTWGIEVDPSQTSDNENAISVWFNTILERGLGIPTHNKVNKYRYKITFINNAGSESPLSAASEIVQWTTPSTAYTFAVGVEIPIGDDDIIARRIYRTKNFSADGGNDGSLYYYVTDIENNFERLYIDDVPDIGLASQAPPGS